MKEWSDKLNLNLSWKTFMHEQGAGEKMVYELDTTSSKLNESKTLLENIINGNIKLNKRIDYSETIMEWY